ncbi:tyrosine-type recombinase/integrase [Photobacterium kishitanii]|nr:tyrosine-type recombinase/integrase [Photobacterium kishitanii]
MGKTRRIDKLYDLYSTPENKGHSLRKRKAPSIPPQSDAELNRIIDDVYSRNRILSYSFLMQALTGLRYSDCSQLMFSDFYHNGKMVDSFPVVQQKTFNARVTKMQENDKFKDWTEQQIYRRAASKSTVTIYVNESISELVEMSKIENPNSEYLFANKHPRSKGFPMDIRNAEYHLKKTERNLQLNYQLRTHSLRKCFAVKLVRNKVNLIKIRDLLGHDSIETTNAYLSTIGTELAQAVSELKYSL